MNIQKLFSFFSCTLSVIALGLVFNSYHQARLNYHILVSKVEIGVFLSDSDNTKIIEENLKNIEGITQVKFIDSDEVLQKAVKSNPDLKEIIIGEHNPFFPYFIVKPYVPTLSFIEILRHRINQIKGVDDVRFDYNLLEIIEKIEDFIAFYYWTICVTLVLSISIIAAKLIRRWMNKTFNLLNYSYLILLGFLSGLSSAFIYYIFGYHILPSQVTHLSAIYFLYFLLGGVIITLIWES